MKDPVDACIHCVLFCRSLSVDVENEAWTLLASIAAQVSVDFQHVLGSVHAGDYEFFLAKLLSPPT
jgi:hypothetical protein